MTSNSSPLVAGPNQGDCYLTENLFGSAGTLFKGIPPNPLALVDLCLLLEAAVTYEQLLVGGFSAIDSPLAARLQSEGILRSLADEYETALSCGQMPPEEDVLFNTVRGTFKMLTDDSQPWGRNLFYISLYDGASDIEARAVNTFNLTTKLSAINAGSLKLPDDESEAWFDKAVRPGLEAYARYGEILATIPRHYEIPTLSGAAEQSLLDHSRLEIALPHELLVKSYGEHFRRQLGKTFRAVPAPPFAGMILGAAKSAEDIVDKLLLFREKYARYRRTIAELREAMMKARQAVTTRDWMEYQKLQSEVENVMRESVKTIEGDMKPKRKLVFRVWDLVKAGSPLKIATNLLDLLIEHDEAKGRVLRVEGIYDVVCAFPDIPFLDVSAERLFGRQLDPKSLQTVTSGIRLLQSLNCIPDEPA